MSTVSSLGLRPAFFSASIKASASNFPFVARTCRRNSPVRGGGKVLFAAGGSGLPEASSSPLGTGACDFSGRASGGGAGEIFWVNVLGGGITISSSGSGTEGGGAAGVCAAGGGAPAAPPEGAGGDAAGAGLAGAGGAWGAGFAAGLVPIPGYRLGLKISGAISLLACAKPLTIPSDLPGSAVTDHPYSRFTASPTGRSDTGSVNFLSFSGSATR